MKGVMVVMMVGGCVAHDEGAVVAPLVSPGGQGVDYQGVDYQGVDYQGVDYQGTSFAGASLEDGRVSGTTLSAWHPIGPNGRLGWEQWFPDRTCTWDSTRYRLIRCTDDTKPSPLVGSRWPATFVVDGQPTTVMMQIAKVQRDTSLAMHPLSGINGTACPPVHCDNPNGCRPNCDLWLYDVRVEDHGELRPLCSSGLSYALAGTWTSTGQYVPSADRFTFTCPAGTIAKCTRWGYRPFGSARRCTKDRCEDTDPVEPLADYHQACIRAGTADYCANGHSHTHNGTLIDIYDFEPHRAGAKGFIPRTWSLEFLADRDMTALATEAIFDVHGASRIDELRYFGALGLPDDPETGCPGQFSQPHPGPDSALIAVRDRIAPDASTPSVQVDSAPMCSHSEYMAGYPLHASCSRCTQNMRAFFGADYAHCSSQRWDASCIAAATKGVGGIGPCSFADRMTHHSECVVGGALPRYGSGCTLRVCLDHAECCSTGWTAACTSAANATCTGGLESPVTQRGFCGVVEPPVPPQNG